MGAFESTRDPIHSFIHSFIFILFRNETQNPLRIHSFSRRFRIEMNPETSLQKKAIS
jgi:hypothetical protein